MNRKPCSPATSILEIELEPATMQHQLRKFLVADTVDGFYVVVELEWLGGSVDQLYLVTRRERTTPRLFKDLNRLNDLLKRLFPKGNIEIFRNMKLPKKAK